MKKNIFAFLAVLIVFAMFMTGCKEDDGKSTTTVTLDPDTLTVKVGESKQITPTDLVATDLTWTSSDVTVATVNGNGQVTGVLEGTATITATARDGGYGTCAVTVIPAVSSTVTLNPTTLTVEIQGSSQITATTEPANTVLTWTSSNVAVATVNPGGWVTGVSAGTATITATARDGGNGTCAVTVIPAVTSEDDVKVVGDTLEHYTAKLVGVNHFGTDLGTTNADGSYTFNGTAVQYSGGGAQYNFPVPKANDTWSLSNYDLVEVFLKVTEGSVQVIVKRSGGNVDLVPYPSGSQYLTLNTTTNQGKYTYKAVIADAGIGIGFQRNQTGPATVAIEKVVFSKVIKYTVTFNDGGAGLSIQPIEVLPNGKVTLPYKPKWSGHTFLGWYDGDTLFNADTSINKNYTLTAKWADGDPALVSMDLDLDPANWGTLPDVPSNWTVGSITWPTEYATTEYDDGKLTITFNGSNRQRAIIPLTDDQVYELMDPSLSGVTFKIVGTVTRGDQGTLTNDQIAAGDLGFAGFRLHLINPSVSEAWNGTTTGKATPLTGNTDPLEDHLVETRTFDPSNKKEATLKYFAIQAMFIDSNNSNGNTATGFPKVIITINSITIEPSND